MNSIVAVILCLGAASRMRPLSVGMPKALIKFCLRPLIEYTLELLIREGITNICLVVSDGDTQFDSYVGWGCERGVSITVVPRSLDHGSGGVLLTLDSFFSATAPFVTELLVVYGDSLLDFDLVAFVAAHRHNRQKGGLVTIGNHSPDDLLVSTTGRTNYGVMWTEQNHRIVRFVEKPLLEEIGSGRANAGVSLWDRRALTLIPKSGPTDLSRDVIQRAASCASSPFFVFPVRYRFDIGTLEEYRRRQLDVVNGTLSLVGAPAIYGTDQRPFAICVGATAKAMIGRGCQIDECTRLDGANILADDVVIESNSKISNSIILDGVRIGSNVCIDGAIIGPRSIIGNGADLTTGTVIGGNETLCKTKSNRLV